jgi:hypothetical protein
VGLDVFSEHIKLYCLPAATKAYLNKLTTDYFPHVIKPSCIYQFMDYSLRHLCGNRSYPNCM